MSDFFSRRHVHRYPKDVELIREVSLEDLSSWLAEHFEGLPQFQERVRDLTELRDILSPIFNEMRDGDEVWVCQSQRRAPLFGHEGVALVRVGRPVLYVRVIQY